MNWIGLGIKFEGVDQFEGYEIGWGGCVFVLY